MSHRDDNPSFPGLPPGSWDGMAEAVAMGMVMEPPDGFLARAVARGLAVVEAEEALVAYREQRSPANDRPDPRAELEELDLDDEDPVTLRPTPRCRHDSGVFPTPPLPDVER